VLPYTPEEVFDLVANVESYPEFLPWWAAARVLRRDGNVWQTDQTVGFANIRYRFRTESVHDRPRRIDITSVSGPIRRLHLTWHFDPLPGGGCQTSLAADIELHSQLIQLLTTGAIDKHVKTIVAAFDARARDLYGNRQPRT
jgi:coenzyme Q-binding protein COQ10